MEEFAERYRAQNDVESIEREYDESFVKPKVIVMTQKQHEALTARLTVLAGETRALGAALEQIRDYEPMDIEGDHFAFAKMQRIARAALETERA